MKGSYILLVELSNAKNILIGKLGYIAFPKAFYAYAGSAMNGFKARLAHHLKDNTKLHWHIDYFLREAKILEIILCSSGQRGECLLAQTLAKDFQFIPCFGASDCKCKSHLYFGDEKDKLREKVIKAVLTVTLSESEESHDSSLCSE